MKLLRFPEWLLDSQGHIHSDRSAKDEQDLGTENELKCLWHVQVKMPNRKLDAWVCGLRGHQAYDSDEGLNCIKMRLKVIDP